MQVSQDEVIVVLRRLGFEVVPDTNGKTMQVTIPTYRTDIQEAADLVEEVIRLLGYDKIPSTIPTGPLPEVQLENWFAREQSIRTALVGAGLTEIVTYTLTSRARMLNSLAQIKREYAAYLLLKPPSSQDTATDKNAGTSVPTSNNQNSLPGTEVTHSAGEPYDTSALPAVVLANSLSSDMEALRVTLLSSLLETLQENSKYSTAGLRLFEIGRRYLPAQDPLTLPDERRAIGIALSGPAEISWHAGLMRPADFFDLKGIVENLLETLKIRQYRITPAQYPTFHPGRSAILELTQTSEHREQVFRPVGVLGEVHPLVQQRYDLPAQAYLCEIDLEALFASVPATTTYQAISRHQALTRDLALIVDRHVPAQAIKETIVSHGGSLLRSVELFDVYTGEPIPTGKKNLTYTLVYQAPDRTLKDAEANDLQDKIIQTLHTAFGATLRS
jgi:phenylalanyl-tRNA synthetase beta chain